MTRVAWRTDGKSGDWTTDWIAAVRICHKRKPENQRSTDGMEARRESECIWFVWFVCFLEPIAGWKTRLRSEEGICFSLFLQHSKNSNVVCFLWKYSGFHQKGTRLELSSTSLPNGYDQ